jgi:hypothetical protein
MYRHRGRTVGTFIIGAIVLAVVIYAAFGRLGSTTMPTPHVIGMAEPLPSTESPLTGARKSVAQPPALPSADRQNS